jgi:hypothetical protein
MSDNTQKVEVFQTRDVGQFYDEENDEFTDELAHDIRDVTAGMVEAEDIDFEMFGEVWTLAGTDEVEAEDESEALNVVFDTWQNKPAGAGRPVSEAFREANDRRLATSMSTGDIVRVNGTAYLCESIGWSEVEAVSC